MWLGQGPRGLLWRSAAWRGGCCLTKAVRGRGRRAREPRVRTVLPLDAAGRHSVCFKSSLAQHQVGYSQGSTVPDERKGLQKHILRDANSVGGHQTQRAANTGSGLPRSPGPVYCGADLYALSVAGPGLAACPAHCPTPRLPACAAEPSLGCLLGGRHSSRIPSSQKGRHQLSADTRWSQSRLSQRAGGRGSPL